MNFGLRNRVEQLLIKLLSADDYDVVRESLVVVQQLYVDCELTLYDATEKVIIGSSIMNEDERTSLAVILGGIRGFSLGGSLVIPKRENIYKVEIFNISKTQTSDIVLVIEHRSNKTLYMKNMDTVFALLGVIAKLERLERMSRTALYTDSLTGLKTRDVLFDEFKSMDIKDVNICVFSLTNAAYLNQTKGVSVTDGYLCEIAQVLSERFKDDVYRIGGTKFLILLKGELFDVNAVMQDVVDSFLSSGSSDITLGAVITPLLEDYYRCVYRCERMMHKIEKNEVVVIREREQSFSCVDTNEVVRNFFPEHLSNYSEKESDEPLDFERVEC